MTHLRGTFMILGAAFLWRRTGGTWTRLATAAKALLTQHPDTVLVVQARVTVSFFILLAVIAVVRPAILRVSWGDLWKFALLGCIGVAGTNFTYYYTIRESTVATAILIQYTAPLVVMSYEVWQGQERLTMPKSLVSCAKY